MFRVTTGMLLISGTTQLLLNWVFRLEGLTFLVGLMVSLRLLLRCAEGSLLNDSEVQKAALHVICNCVCGPRVRVRLQILCLRSGSFGNILNLRNCGR